MKVFYILMLLMVTISTCKKEASPEELEHQKLATMKENIINDWTVVKIIEVKPASQYGTIVHSNFCNENETFSFKSDGSFMYAGNPLCSSKNHLAGSWNLPKTDSLFIKFATDRLVAYENLEVTELSANKMKWNIVSSTGDGNGNVTIELTLVPR